MFRPADHCPAAQPPKKKDSVCVPIWELQPHFLQSLDGLVTKAISLTHFFLRKGGIGLTTGRIRQEYFGNLSYVMVPKSDQKKLYAGRAIATIATSRAFPWLAGIFWWAKS